MRLNFAMTRHLFEAHLFNRGYSRETVARYLREMTVFCMWLGDERGKGDLGEVAGDDITAYQIYLAKAEKKGGKALRFSESTRRGMIQSVKGLFRFLSRNEYIVANPFDELDVSMIAVKGLRRSIPEHEVGRLLDSISLDNPLSIRDRALFELMYGTGLRVSEVSMLNLTDVDLHTGRLMVRQGKGRKDRIVPLGRNVSRYLELYLKQCREFFLPGLKEKSAREALFLGISGRCLGIGSIEARLKKWYQKLEPDTGKNICPHMLRHSFATHMLDHGAGIKEVKEILGHSCIESTAGYTHFSVASLKRILKMYHPRENELYVELSSEDEDRFRRILTGDLP